MRVYIAAPWTAKGAARDVADLFEGAGFEITKRWWDHREVPGYLVNDADNDELHQQAIEDIAGVADADVFVLLNYAKSEGKAFETAIAWVMGTPIVVVGGKSNLFHYLSIVTEADNILDAITIATEKARARRALRTV